MILPHKRGTLLLGKLKGKAPQGVVIVDNSFRMIWRKVGRREERKAPLMVVIVI